MSKTRTSPCVIHFNQDPAEQSVSHLTCFSTFSGNSTAAAIPASGCAGGHDTRALGPSSAPSLHGRFHPGPSSPPAPPQGSPPALCRDLPSSRTSASWWEHWTPAERGSSTRHVHSCQVNDLPCRALCALKPRLRDQPKVFIGRLANKLLRGC